jgi:hypothetical protein
VDRVGGFHYRVQEVDDHFLVRPVPFRSENPLEP